MTEDDSFPPYIPRAQEQSVRDEVRRVCEDRISRAVLLYGDGGVGKTDMLREMAAAGTANQNVAWLDPIDVDDTEYWLLSSLEQRIINELDPDEEFFGPYLGYLRRLPGNTLDCIDRETVVSHLDAVKQEFASCYTRFVDETGKIVVIIFDTVEVIRGLSLLYTLTEWIKSLPATLFVLSGRPIQDEARADPIQRELRRGPNRLVVTPIKLGEFTWEEAHEYLAKSRTANALSDEEKDKLVLLTRGYPLWLAFTITYLTDSGFPQEAELSLAELQQNMPYGEPMSRDGHLCYSNYKRRLTTPFQYTDFQHETIRRLAVVRQNISQEIWERLMADLVEPEGITSLAVEWNELRQIPWIRARSNDRYITLHDAVAEEISRQVIPLHDGNQEWRRERWRQAARIYADLGDELAADLTREQERLDTRQKHLGEHSRLVVQVDSTGYSVDDDESSLVADIVRLDWRRRELDDLRAISLHYDLLSDSEKGAQQFLTLFEQARQQKDPLPRERLAVEIQQFLPSSAASPQEGVVGQAIRTFRDWLTNAGEGYYQKIVKNLAAYQIESEQPQAANETIGDLPERVIDPILRFDLNLLKGNALMRIPDESSAAEHYFKRALEEADTMTSDDATLQQARAHKEFGFYHRQRGKWRAAKGSYHEAFRLISKRLADNSRDEDRKELASIERNWAYVNGISGDFSDATNLIESAIAIYRHFGMQAEEAAAWSVKGEINRYGWQFTLAWRSYEEAEKIFQMLRDRAWLGVIFQEQAICLVQAHRKGIQLLFDRDPRSEAERLIRQALMICREQNLRSYPSALNRAARILGADDIDTGLRYAAQGIDWGSRLSDGWKWTACLVEYVDLSWRGWAATGEERYRQGIRDRASDVDRATATTDFRDLRGRWHILQGHIKVQDWIFSHDLTRLDGALEHYVTGFKLVAETFIGSSSAFTVGIEFERFAELFRQLPKQVRTEWLREFRRSWSEPGNASTVLIARIEELY